MYHPIWTTVQLLVLLVVAAHFVHCEPSPAPEPYPAIVSLPSRPTAQRSLSKSTVIASLPDVEHDLLPFVLVSTIDGALHAVDRESGKIKWSLKDGVEPLIGGGIRGKSNGEEYIVEPLSGDLYVFDNENTETGGGGGEPLLRDGSGSEQPPKIRKLPLSVEQLIELSPFAFPHSPSRIFTGSKNTALISIDLRNGQQLDCFSSLSSNYSDSNTEEDYTCQDDRLLDDLEGKSRSNSDILFIGRTDYRLTIHSPGGSSSMVPSTSTAVPEERGMRAGAQEITYSTYTPNSYDRPLAEYWAKLGAAEQAWEEHGHKRMRVELGHDGAAVGVEQGGGVKWVKSLGNVGIGVYDILLPLHPPNANPILVPQPPPDLRTLFPLPAQPAQSHVDVLSKPPSTYVGAVSFQKALPPANDAPKSTEPIQPDNKQSPKQPSTSKQPPLLYALSSSAYPLINFAPPPRPGSLTNGTFSLSQETPDKDQLLPYLIDPPTEGETPLIAGGDIGDTPPPLDDRFRGRLWIRKGWVWWGMGVLSALTVFVAALTGMRIARFSGFSSQERESITPSTRGSGGEDTVSLLTLHDKPSGDPPRQQQRQEITNEKSVMFLEPPIDRNDASGSTSGGGVKSESEEATPKKKTGRRRVRGKKKKKDDNSVGGGDDDDEEYDEKTELLSNAASGGSSGIGSGSGGGNSGKSSGGREKPLPDLPREMSSIDLRDEDKERLTISDNIIGYGSHGTVVLKGTWGGRPVAVKRLLSDFTRLASQEVKLLQASDDHPNVIRYYCQERRDNFLYIALDLCQASLADLIESPDKYLELASVLDRKKALVQVTAGLKHLHGMKIIHRDIKPQNVLVSQLKDGSLRLLVSDFGLARRLEQDQSSFAPTANNLAGSIGWRAPECIRGQVRLNEGFERLSHSGSGSSSTSSNTSLVDLAAEEEADVAIRKDKSQHRLTKAVDLFALGCLYFWVLMSGEHPYGETYNRESNIVKGDPINMGSLDILGEEGCEAKELIGKLLEMDPADRPDTEECLRHPFFWTPAKRLSFLCDASDRFEIMETDPPQPTLVMLETNAVQVVGKDWFSRADKAFTSNLGKYRKYKGNSVRDLLRAMRNKKHHYQDLEPSIKRHLGALPAGFLFYFTSRYPMLFLHVWKVVRESRLQKEPMFDQYFQEGS